MNSKLVSSMIITALCLPVAAYAADDKATSNKSTVSESIKQNVGDSVITAKIKAEMVKDKKVSAMKINVDTDGKGVVTLSGNAKDQVEIDEAVKIARSVKGVTSVKNNIKVSAK